MVWVKGLSVRISYFSLRQNLTTFCHLTVYQISYWHRACRNIVLANTLSNSHQLELITDLIVMIHTWRVHCTFLEMDCRMFPSYEITGSWKIIAFWYLEKNSGQRTPPPQPQTDTPLWTDKRFWKHYLPTTSFAGGKYYSQETTLKISQFSRMDPTCTLRSQSYVNMCYHSSPHVCTAQQMNIINY